MKLALTLVVCLLISPPGRAQDATQSPTARKLTSMLRQFLKDASEGNPPGFETFFADDIIYTRSTGVVIGKADIMKGVERLKPTEESKTTYSSEDITIHEYGGTAVVAFRLVARTEHKDGRVETQRFRNTGTFLRRQGRWQAVAWQATMIFPPGANSGH